MCVYSRSQTAHSLHFNIFYFAYSTVLDIGVLIVEGIKFIKENFVKVMIFIKLCNIISKVNGL